MISGASDEELEIMNARAKVLSICGSEVLEILDKTNEEYEKKLKSAINELNWDVDKLSRGLTKKDKENNRLNNIINELEKYTVENIEVLKNRLNSPFCNFEKVTKELLIFQNYLDKLKALKENNNGK